MKNYLMWTTMGFGGLLTLLTLLLSVLKIVSESVCLGIAIGIFVEATVVFSLIALTMSSKDV